MRRLLRSETFVALGGQIVQLTLTFATGILIARILGPSNYGIFNILRNTFLTVAILSPLGLDIGLLKYCGKAAPGDMKAIHVVSQLRRLVFAINFAVFLAFAFGLSKWLMDRYYHYEHFDILLSLIMIGLPITADLGISGAVFKARGQAAWFSLLTLYLQSLARIVMVGAAALFSPTLPTLVGVNVLQLAISEAGIFLFNRKKRPAPTAEPGPSGTADWGEVRLVLRESLWMALNMFVYGVMRLCDTLILSGYVAAREVGEYAALNTIAALVQIYPLAASQSLGPNVSRHFHAGDLQGVRKVLDDYIRFAAIASGFVFAGVAVFGERLDLIFGHDFQFNPIVCFIMPLGYILSATLAPTGFALSMTGRHKQELVILVIGNLTLLALCRLLIPGFGQIGAASAVALAFALTNILRFAYVSRVLGFIPGRLSDIAPAFVALAAAYAAKTLGNLLGPPTLITTFVSCVVYAAGFGGLCYWLFLSAEGKARLAIAAKERFCKQA